MMESHAPTVPPRFRAGLWMVAGLVVTAIAVFAATALVRPSGAEPVIPPLPDANDPGVVDDLVAAWDRYRRTEWVMVGEFERELDSGEVTTTTTVEVQRVPDRLVIRGDSVTGRLDGREVSCATDASGTTRCVWGAEVDPAYDHRVELTALRTYGVDDDPLYVIERKEGCFHLDLRRRIELPPFGQRATLCFDAETGVLIDMEVHHEGFVDRVRAVSVRTDVTDADLRLPVEPDDPGATTEGTGGRG